MSNYIPEAAESDFDLLDLLIALGKEKWILLVVTFLAAVAGVFVSFVTPATYVARTIILPSQQSSSGGLPAIGGLAGLAGIGGLPNIGSSSRNSDEMLIALMRSQSVQTALIEKLKLKMRYGSKNLEEARQSLTQNVVIVSDKKSGLISIDAQDADPEFAAQLANEQVKELNFILSRLAITEVQQRRVFYEKQILNAHEKIPQLEQKFKEAQKNAGIEIVSMLSEVGTLPDQIAAKELQIQVLSRFATVQNPEIRTLAAEISALRGQMAKYELSTEQAKLNSPLKPEKQAKDSKSDLVQKAKQEYNTLKIQEAMLDGFIKQFEMAKLDESKEGQIVQVVDEAKPPEMRATPQRRKLVIAYTVTGLIFGFVLAALKAFLRNVKSTSKGHTRYIQLKLAWGFSKG